MSSADIADIYPEHFKLAAINEQSQTCGEFIDWLERRGYHLCEIDPERAGRYWPTHRPIVALLSEFFDIDLKKIDAEKVAMLDAIRAANDARSNAIEVADDAQRQREDSLHRADSSIEHEKWRKHDGH